jgi:hypothetical protein
MFFKYMQSHLCTTTTLGTWKKCLLYIGGLKKRLAVLLCLLLLAQVSCCRKMVVVLRWTGLTV